MSSLAATYERLIDAETKALRVIHPDFANEVLIAAGGVPEAHGHINQKRKRVRAAAKALSKLTEDPELVCRLEDQVREQRRQTQMSSLGKTAWNLCECSIDDCVLLKTRKAWDAEQFSTSTPLELIREENGGSLGVTAFYAPELA